MYFYILDSRQWLSDNHVSRYVQKIQTQARRSWSDRHQKTAHAQSTPEDRDFRVQQRNVTTETRESSPDEMYIDRLRSDSLEREQSLEDTPKTRDRSVNYTRDDAAFPVIGK